MNKLYNNNDVPPSRKKITTESKIDKELLKSAIFSLGGKVDRNDIVKLVDDGIITTEDAREIVTKMEDSVVRVDKNMKQLALHRQACLILARNAGDPSYRKITDNYLEREKLFNQLDAKYGQQAKINQAALLQEIESTVSTESTRLAFRDYK